MKQIAFNNHNIALLDNDMNKIESTIHDKINNLKFKKGNNLNKNYRRITISIPIDLDNEIKEFKSITDMKLNISKICQLAIRKQIKSVIDNLDMLKELETKKNLFDFEVKQIEHRINTLLNS